jgi:hypothetical protein
VIRRLAAATAMLAAAAFLLLFARDVWHWAKAVRDADARASVRPIAPAAWSADTTLPFALAERTLGIGPDLAFRRVSMAAIAALLSPQGTTLKQHAPIEAALARIEHEDPDRARASRAANYLGIFFYADPVPPQEVGITPSDRAIGEFENAVRLDPGNETAEHNLELLLEQRSRVPRGRSKPGGGQKGGNQGAGLGTPGNGF